MQIVHRWRRRVRRIPAISIGTDVSEEIFDLVVAGSAKAVEIARKRIILNDVSVERCFGRSSRQLECFTGLCPLSTGQPRVAPTAGQSIWRAASIVAVLTDYPHDVHRISATVAGVRRVEAQRNSSEIGSLVVAHEGVVVIDGQGTLGIELIG